MPLFVKYPKMCPLGDLAFYLIKVVPL